MGCRAGSGSVGANAARVHGPIAIIAYGQNHLRWAQHFAALKAIGFIVWHKYNEPVVSPGLTREHQIVCIWGRSMKQLNVGAVRQPYKSEERMRRFHGKGGLIMERTGRNSRPSRRRSMYETCGSYLPNYRASIATNGCTRIKSRSNSCGGSCCC